MLSWETPKILTHRSHGRLYGNKRKRERTAGRAIAAEITGKSTQAITRDCRSIELEIATCKEWTPQTTDWSPTCSSFHAPQLMAVNSQSAVLVGVHRKQHEI
eukprot:jgi/Ulvmu1/9860/UM057_0014.1